MIRNEIRCGLEGYQAVAGCDEAGRGCLAGPVVAAAVVIMPEAYPYLEDVYDSKKIAEKKRKTLYNIIMKYTNVGIGIISAEEIDKLNIYVASRQAMLQALTKIEHDYVLTDAMPLPGYKTPVDAIIKGDQKSLSIAAASIIAKCTRDNLLVELDKQHPEYGFAQHKGYGTKKHLEMLKKYGVLEGIHRKSYAPVRKLLVKQEQLF